MGKRRVQEVTWGNSRPPGQTKGQGGGMCPGHISEVFPHQAKQLKFLAYSQLEKYQGNDNHRTNFQLTAGSKQLGKKKRHVTRVAHSAPWERYLQRECCEGMYSYP